MLYKIKISSIFIFSICISFLLHIEEEIIFMFVLDIIHEIGHVVFAKLFHLEIEKFSIMIYGTSASIKDIEYEKTSVQIMIFLAGPLTVIISQIFLLLLQSLTLISTYYYAFFTSMNVSLCLFNLLPIYPLDGGRILDVILKKIYPIKKAIKIRFIFNVFALFLLILILFFKRQYFIFIMLMLCLISECVNYYSSYITYLKKRYTKNIIFKEEIVEYPNFYHFKKNIYFIGGKYYDESQIITKLLLEKTD